MLDHIQHLIAELDNSIKDDIIFKITNILEKIKNELIKQKLTKFIALLNGTTTSKEKQRKRKLGELTDQWDKLSLSTVVSSDFPNKKPKTKVQ
jgi:hypothetical protein